MTPIRPLLTVTSLAFLLAGCGPGKEAQGQLQNQPSTAPQSSMPSTTPQTPGAGNNSPLETTVAFSDPEECTPAAALEKLFHVMAPMDDVGRPVEPFSTRIAPIAGAILGEPRLTSKGGLHTVDLSLKGDWHGLQLTSLSIYWVEESDASGSELRFANPPAQVIATLNALGFGLAIDGTRQSKAELSTFLSVRPKDGGSVFSCSI